ncbi:MAG: hypothetical protein EXR99_11350 [Gemmataceae bacterium]|nr:hypothetical protein [Gemmataceae bacterium]
MVHFIQAQAKSPLEILTGKGPRGIQQRLGHKAVEERLHLKDSNQFGVVGKSVRRVRIDAIRFGRSWNGVAFFLFLLAAFFSFLFISIAHWRRVICFAPLAGIGGGLAHAIILACAGRSTTHEEQGGTNGNNRQDGHANPNH